MKRVMAFAILGIVLSGAAASADVGDRSNNLSKFTCRFEYDAGKAGATVCHAKIRVQPQTTISEARNDRNFMNVECNGYEIYKDGFLSDRFRDDLLIQGITSEHNLTPPSILLKDVDRDHNDHDSTRAVLTASFGQVWGQCWAHDGDDL